MVRRCILNRAYSLSGGGGLFIANVNGILFEENVIDHNGWHESISGAAANAFSHNTYFQVSNTNLIFRNNIVARASATGGGFRCGGIITNNLFLANPKNIQFGTHETVNGSGGGLNWPAQFVSGELSNNVVLDCRLEGFEAGTGIQVQRAKNTSVHHNLIAHFSPVSNYNIGAVLNETDNIDFHHNTIYNWGNNNTSGNSYGSGLICGAAMIGNSQIHDNDFQINNQRGACVSQNVAFGQTSYQNNHYFNVQTGGSWYQQWFQPQGNYTAWVAASGETGSTNTPINYTAANQNISTYMSSVGNPGGLDEFLSWSSQNSRCNWDDARTANAVNEYMRAGFNISVSLPLILTTLEGDFHDGGMLLRWTSTEEKDLDTYTVQRSNNGVKWQRLAELQARNKEKSEYHFYDNAPMATNYYRLQIRELNGATTYSRMLQMQMLHEQNFTLSPNPASTYLKLESKSLAIQHVQIVNAQNHICLQASGDNSPIFDIQHLPPGVYFVHIWAAGQFAVKKWVKI